MIGKLRHRLILQEPLLTDDGAGGQNRVWQDVAKIWADRRDISGAEADFADSLSATTRTRIIIRWRSDVNSLMRFVDGARVFNIISVTDPHGTKRFLTCLCEENLRERKKDGQA